MFFKRIDFLLFVLQKVKKQISTTIINGVNNEIVLIKLYPKILKPKKRII